MNRTYELQGHRGARGLKPENTLPAFEEALDRGVDTLELDLHLSEEGQLVVWHDPFVSAKKCSVPAGADDLPDPTRQPPDDSRLLLRNLRADQLARYRCDVNPHPLRFPDQDASPTALAGNDYGIVTLPRLFTFVSEYAKSSIKTDRQRLTAANVRFNLELKRDPARPEYIDDNFDGEEPGEFEKALVLCVEQFGLRDKVLAQSFDHRCIWAIRKLAPWLEVAALEKIRRASLSELAARGASVWTPHHSLVTKKSLAEAHAKGLRVVPWTVNNPARMRKLVDIGVDGIITDRPDLAP